jgi:hypothetical protein
MDDRYDEEVRRLAEVLATVLRVARRTRQSVEHDLDLSSGYLSKILGGTVDLRVRHILAISEAAGMDPANFFSLAYPPREQDSETRRFIANVQAAMGQQPALALEPSAEFDEAVRRSLARILGFRLDEPAPKQP